MYIYTDYGKAAPRILNVVTLAESLTGVAKTLAPFLPRGAADTRQMETKQKR